MIVRDPRRHLAREIYAEKIAFLIGKREPVVLIERAVAIAPRIDTKFERTVRLLVRALHNGLHGNDCSGANVKRRFRRAPGADEIWSLEECFSAVQKSYQSPGGK